MRKIPAESAIVIPAQIPYSPSDIDDRQIRSVHAQHFCSLHSELLT